MRRFRRPFLYVIAFVIVTLIGLHLVSNTAPQANFYKQFEQYPLVMGHADDTGSGLWPGNSFAYLNGLAELKVDVLEMDVHMSKDGHIVLMHDEAVDRTSNGTGLIREMSLVELEALEIGGNWSQDGGVSHPYAGKGEQIPMLAAVFAQFPDYPMIIEIKQKEPSIAKPLCTLIQQYQMEDKVIVPSFSDQAMKEFRAVCPKVATAAAADEVKTFVYLHFPFLSGILSPDYTAFQVPQKSGGVQIISPMFIRAAHRKGIEVHVWTVNDPEEMQQLVELGVDGIMTDRPDILLDLLGR